MPRTPRPWRGSLRAHKGRILLTVKDSSGRWVERSTGHPDTPQGWRDAEKVRRDVVGALQAREEATGSTGPVSVKAWSEKWLAGRIGRDKGNDEARLRLHVLPGIGSLPLDEVRPRHLDALAKEWTAAGLAPRTRRNVYSVVKAMFRDAVIADLLDAASDPCVLTHRQLGKVKDAPGFVRREALYSRDELQALISDERVPLDRRVWYGLLGLGMLRTGEAAGLRWNRIVPAEPLHRIVVCVSYEGETKTEQERHMPVHPALAGLLAEWKIGGWAKMMGRPPAAEDLVCPAPAPTNRGPRKPHGAMRDKNWARKRLVKDLVALDLRHRRAHDLRRTGISIAQDDGADRMILRWGTHAPPQEVFDLYTSLDWTTLCREVAKARIVRVTSGPGGTGRVQGPR